MKNIKLALITTSQAYAMSEVGSGYEFIEGSDLVTGLGTNTSYYTQSGSIVDATVAEDCEIVTVTDGRPMLNSPIYGMVSADDAVAIGLIKVANV